MRIRTTLAAAALAATALLGSAGTAAANDGPEDGPHVTEAYSLDSNQNFSPSGFNSISNDDTSFGPMVMD
ncbi:hypothetical protein [Streptomyces flavofungini]|uniref:hypothetical protein n=1 Tax=Streptomyces flavofungini TaxID=68200 RepID=UPI0034DF6274